MPAPRIFVSYRRDDSAGYARAIADTLERRFGAGQVFIDVDDIGAGQAFDAAIDRAVGGARVLLVLIGRRWLGAPDGASLRRIDEPGDFVRREVATGLARGLQVIPLLLDGAAMPTEDELPAELKPLARRNALSIDNAGFAADLDRLESVLRGILGLPVGPSRRRLGLAALGLGAVALAAALVWAWRPAPPAPLRPALNGRWVADVTYDWPNARYTERFAFAGEGTALQGTASFLRYPRSLVDGRIDPDGSLVFSTRTTEQSGADLRELTHRFRGRLAGDQLRLVLQIEASGSPHAPIEIVARREAP